MFFTPFASIFLANALKKKKIRMHQDLLHLHLFVQGCGSMHVCGLNDPPGSGRWAGWEPRCAPLALPQVSCVTLGWFCRLWSQCTVANDRTPMGWIEKSNKSLDAGNPSFIKFNGSLCRADFMGNDEMSFAGWGALLCFGGKAVDHVECPIQARSSSFMALSWDKAFLWIFFFHCPHGCRALCFHVRTDFGRIMASFSEGFGTCNMILGSCPLQLFGYSM